MFYFSVLVFSVACTVITIKTLVGYSDLRFGWKALISGLVIAGWFAPLYIGFLRNFNLNSFIFDLISFIGYTLFGFMFLLLVLLLFRDVLWYAFYGAAKLLGYASWNINPKNISVLAYANLAVVGLAGALTWWALYAGTKIPAVRELTIYTPLVTRDWRIVQLSDLHVTRSTPLWRVNKVVEKINSLQPDMVFMTGDIIDDKMPHIQPQIDALARIETTQGVWSVMGNHEFYNGINAWDYKFSELGFHTLFNRGELIKETNIFVSGIPDLTTAQSHPTFNIHFPQALQGSSRENFRILLSHNPQVADNLTSSAYNLQLSGHTHGGQIFPFHLLVKKANNYLSGLYKVNGFDLYVSNGAGTWGPNMRLFAPSELTVINLRPVEPAEINPLQK